MPSELTHRWFIRYDSAYSKKLVNHIMLVEKKENRAYRKIDLQAVRYIIIPSVKSNGKQIVNLIYL